MSVTFRSSTKEVNISNINAVEIADFIGLSIRAEDGSLCGEVESSLLACLCGRALMRDANETDNTIDPGVKCSEEDGSKGVRIINCGRDAGYLPRRVRELRQLAIEADKEIIYWD